MNVFIRLNGVAIPQPVHRRPNIPYNAFIALGPKSFRKSRLLYHYNIGRAFVTRIFSFSFPPAKQYPVGHLGIHFIRSFAIAPTLRVHTSRRLFFGLPLSYRRHPRRSLHVPCRDNLDHYILSATEPFLHSFLHATRLFQYFINLRYTPRSFYITLPLPHPLAR